MGSNENVDDVILNKHFAKFPCFGNRTPQKENTKKAVVQNYVTLKAKLLIQFVILYCRRDGCGQLKVESINYQHEINMGKQ